MQVSEPSENQGVEKQTQPPMGAVTKSHYRTAWILEWYYSYFAVLTHWQRAQDLPGGSDGKASAYNVGDLGLIPGLGRSPGEGKGYLVQYSVLENSMESQRVKHD